MPGFLEQLMQLLRPSAQANVDPNAGIDQARPWDSPVLQPSPSPMASPSPSPSPSPMMGPIEDPIQQAMKQEQLKKAFAKFIPESATNSIR